MEGICYIFFARNIWNSKWNFHIMCGFIRFRSRAVLDLVRLRFGLISFICLIFIFSIGISTIPHTCYTCTNGMSIITTSIRLIDTIGRGYFTVLLDRLLLLSNLSSFSTTSFTWLVLFTLVLITYFILLCFLIKRLNYYNSQWYEREDPEYESIEMLLMLLLEEL